MTVMAVVRRIAVSSGMVLAMLLIAASGARTHAAPPAQTPPPRSTGNAQARQLNQRGLGLMESDPMMAARAFDDACRADPTWAEPWCNLTLAQFRWVIRNGGRVEGSVRYLYRGYSLDPSLMNKYEAELVKLEEPLQQMAGFGIDSDLRIDEQRKRQIMSIPTADAAYQEGLRLRKQNTARTSAEAAWCHLRALQLDPLHAEARYSRGKIFHFGLSNPYPNVALLNYSAAIRLKPDHWQAYRFRAQVWQSMFVEDMALADLSSAILLKPDFAPLYSERAVSAWALGKNDLYQSDLKKCRQLDPQNWQETWQTVQQDIQTVKDAAQRRAEIDREIAEMARWDRQYQHDRAIERANEAEQRGDLDTARRERERAGAYGTP